MKYVFGNYNNDWNQRRLKRLFWISVTLVDFTIMLFILYMQYWVGGGK